jgi:hypothetical protein
MGCKLHPIFFINISEGVNLNKETKTMATRQISVEYDLLLPNDFLIDHSTSEGKTRKTTYHGPDKLYLQIGEDGSEVHGPLTEDNIMDGRPMPADVVEWFEVDCTENPLLCQLRGPIDNSKQEEYTGTVLLSSKTPEVEGYPQFSYSTPLMPADIYAKYSIKVVDGEVQIPRFTVTEKLLDRPTDLTWEEIRRKRDDVLSATDGKVTEDMPEDLKNEWKTYRQLLRDLPATLQAAGVEPNWAFYMFPDSPDAQKPPKNSPDL